MTNLSWNLIEYSESGAGNNGTNARHLSDGKTTYGGTHAEVVTSITDPNQAGELLTTTVVTENFATHSEDTSYDEIRFGGSNQLSAGWTIDLEFLNRGEHIVDTKVDVVITTDSNDVTTEVGSRHTSRDNILDLTGYSMQVAGQFGGGGLTGQFSVSADGGTTSISTEDITMIDGTITDRKITERLNVNSGYHFQMSAKGNGIKIVSSAGGASFMEQDKWGNLNYELIDGVRTNQSSHRSIAKIDGVGDSKSSGSTSDTTHYRMTRYSDHFDEFLLNQYNQTTQGYNRSHDGRTGFGSHGESSSITRVVNSNGELGAGKTLDTVQDTLDYVTHPDGSITGVVELNSFGMSEDMTSSAANDFATLVPIPPFFDPTTIVTSMLNYAGGGSWSGGRPSFSGNGSHQEAPDPTGPPVGSGTEPDGTYWERYDNGVFWIYREYASEGGTLVKEDWGYHTESFFDLLKGFNQLIEDAVEVIPIDAFFADLTEVGEILSGANNVPAAAKELETGTQKLLENFLPSANEPFYEYATVIGGLLLNEEDTKLVKEILDKFHKEVKTGENKLSEKLEIYLEGLYQGKQVELLFALANILATLEQNQNEIINNPGDFVIGLGKGFGQGLLNNVDEVWELVKSSININYLLAKTYYYELSLQSRIYKLIWGEELPGAAENRKEFKALVKDFKEKAVTIGNLALAVGNLLDTLKDKFGDKAERVLAAVISGDEQAIKDLGDEDGKIAMLMLSLALDVLDQYKDLSAEDQGIIFGKITAELGLIVGGALLTGGGSAAAKSGKLAVIADKLKSLDKAGKLSEVLEKVLGKNSRFARKLDEFILDEAGTVGPGARKASQESIRENAQKRRDKNFPFEEGKFRKKTYPSGTRGGKPTGKPKSVDKNADPEQKRSIRRENETGQILANEGYDVEYLPETKIEGVKNPDLRVEGKIFDVYSPSTDDVRSILQEVNKKAAKKQAARVVINLRDSNVSIRELRRLFEYEDGGLRPDMLEVKIIDKHGRLINFFP